MDLFFPEIGFTYFRSAESLIKKQTDSWLPQLASLGAKFVIFRTGYQRGIPEDVFETTRRLGLKPIIHVDVELPLPKDSSQLIVLINAFARWGVKKIILGDKPNLRTSWPSSGWHFENLVDHFLDRFIPLASESIQRGMQPILSPMYPGGDYWDSAFLELVLSGLKKRKLEEIHSNMALASYGYTFNKPLSWGRGGPERWSEAKPYASSGTNEDQIGFSQYEWVQAIGKKVTGCDMPVLIVDCGNTGIPAAENFSNAHSLTENIKKVLDACRSRYNPEKVPLENDIAFPGHVLGCTFSLEAIKGAFGGNLSLQNLKSLFQSDDSSEWKLIFDDTLDNAQSKFIRHYLLLPQFSSGISDAILNKVRPYIKKYHPTIGFSFEEAIRAEKVTVFFDASSMTENQMDQLRNAGCHVEILPESGIEIATSLNGATSLE